MQRMNLLQMTRKAYSTSKIIATIMANIAATKVATAVQSSALVAAARLVLVKFGLIVTKVRAKPDVNAEVNKTMQAFRDFILSWPWRKPPKIPMIAINDHMVTLIPFQPSS